MESAHSGEALLPDVGYTSASGDGRPGSSSRGSGARLKKTRRGENTPLIRAGAGARHRSEYEDLDDEAFNNWPSKSETYLLIQFQNVTKVKTVNRHQKATFSFVRCNY